MYRLEWLDNGVPCIAHADGDVELAAILKVGCDRGSVVSVVALDREPTPYEAGLATLFQRLSHPCQADPLTSADAEWLHETGIEP